MHKFDESTSPIRRRTFIGGAAALLMVAMTPLNAAWAQGSATAQKIADHFSSVKTMAGEFVQFGPRGEQTGGKFYLERPGKIRFNFEDPSPMRVISDGKSVVIGNRKLKTWDIYPLSKTPLALLLSNKIDLGSKTVRDVKEEPDLITIKLGDKSLFADSTITMMFDPKTYDLRQWTITDNQGKDTSVMIFNVQTGVPLDDKVFKVPYDEVHNQNSVKRR
ncbi:outer membrane lipoprotein carrier protein LolA [Rhizobium sp. KVB221]|uniref:Outer membrane lipoprotein carrier protein LolA n=1 Tax=Rhizobium setariae TaxID=2801340 RepID=A0A936YWS0_9HYPH|nr:outer membrane lipoprotein carrier protein LolA [Rhizobium setariae]MBL0374970.1 outer membrane lipoprotein carrier protein LolA [Rhizobium setariae]